MSSESQYKDTLLLPQTTFPMRGDLVDNEPKRLAIWEKQDLYQKILARRRAHTSRISPPGTWGEVRVIEVVARGGCRPWTARSRAFSQRHRAASERVSVC